MAITTEVKVPTPVQPVPTPTQASSTDKVNGSNYTQDQVNQWQSSAEYNDLSNRFLDAQRNGNVGQYDILQKEATSTMDKMFAKPAFDMQAYINGITSAGNASIDSANASRQAMIDARLQEQLGAQAGLERDAEGNLIKNTETIQNNTYDAQETQKATGVQRGIQYSQQQQGLEQGINRAGTKMIVDAGKDRDSAILNIRDRIASLKSGASYEKQASQSQADSEKSSLLQQATDTATKRDWQLGDIKNSNDFQITTIKNANEFAVQERIADENFKTKLTQEGWANDEKVAITKFNNDVKMMGIDDKYKRAFLELSTQQQLKVMGVQNTYDLVKLDKQFINEKIITGMNINAQISMNNSDNATSRANTQANIQAGKEENQARIDATIKANAEEAKGKTNAEKVAMIISAMKADPKFNIASNDPKSNAQRKVYAELYGIDLKYLNQSLGLGTETINVNGNSGGGSSFK